MSRISKYIFCALVLLLTFVAIGTGDVGNFNDYSGGGSSWGSSSGGRNSGSSSGSSFDWGSSSRDSDTNFSSSAQGSNWVDFEERERGSSFDFILGMIVFLVAVFVFSLWTKTLKAASHPEIADHTADITRALQETDPAFNATAFLEWAKEVFLKLQYAWMDRDWEKVRPFESEELYAQHERQLQEYKRRGCINVLERINVNNAYFFSLEKDKNWETLSVVMQVRMIDYIIDEHSRKVLKGTPDKDCFLNYFYVFKRRAGVKTTSAKQEVGTVACPNCGAPTRVVSAGKCEFCDFVITVKDHGWVLADIIGIKPPYNYGAGGVIRQDKSEE